ncbi:hypothetical protein A0H81_03506 [Grifola frondosa]|uniref:Uncharacterized protein n=1 Tax=Grifola frondosa TaxID=5627 RepID=A0A1C7MGI0_GRIFR|nr:hypothetical protein A0H81_03506 [Grifola frondosa]
MWFCPSQVKSSVPDYGSKSHLHLPSVFRALPPTSHVYSKLNGSIAGLSLQRRLERYRLSLDLVPRAFLEKHMPF